MAENDSKKKADSDHHEPLFSVIDRRIFTDPEHLDLGSIEPEKPRFPTYVEELQARVQEAERKFEERKRQMQDEIAKTRARLEADLERRVADERQKFVEPLLDILDNLERALAAADAGSRESLQEGVRLTASLFLQRLSAQGIEPFEVLNLQFDPNVSEAIGAVEVEQPERDGIVVEELRRGFRAGERVLRHARVRVGQFAGRHDVQAAALEDSDAVR